MEKGVPEELKRQNHLLEDYFDAFEDETGKIGVMFFYNYCFVQMFLVSLKGLCLRGDFLWKPQTFILEWMEVLT